MITQIASGARRLKLGAIHPTRDFNFVTDIVAGFIAAMESGKGLGEVVNLGSNFEVSIGEMVGIVAETMSVQVEIAEDLTRLRPEKSEVERLWADNTKAQVLFGWTPEHGGLAGFRRGLRKTVEWFSPSNLGHYKSGQYNI